MCEIVIATHGKMAAGMKDSLKLITGEEENIRTISGFTEDVNPRTVIEELFKNTDRNQEMIIFTDMMGGSINQMFIPYLRTHKIHLITGCNLPLICQLILTVKESVTVENICEAVELAREELKYVNTEISLSDGGNDSDDTFFE